MGKDEQKGRLSGLSRMPLSAQMDHRLFLNAEGKDSRLQGLSRARRRKLDKEARALGALYQSKMLAQVASGAGYQIDKVIREFSLEYNNRYATSGVQNQPINFNYIEPFLSLEFLPNSYAPFLSVRDEVDHLFYLEDFLDFLTDPAVNIGPLASIYDQIADGKNLNFTFNGSIKDNVVLTADRGEYVVSGFSLVRHGDYLNWVLVAGHVLSDEEWNALASFDGEFEISHIIPRKRKFLEEAIARSGASPGGPLPLEGTERAVRTVLAGEFDLLTQRHVARCLLTEFENTFLVVTDDPETLVGDGEKRKDLAERWMLEMEEAAPLWNLVDGLFAVVRYFSERISVTRLAGKSLPRAPSSKSPNGSVGFRYISSIEYERKRPASIASYLPERYQIEKAGHWRRLERGKFGYGPRGEQVAGRTWIKEQSEWRVRPSTSRTIYVKSLLSHAKEVAERYMAVDANPPAIGVADAGLPSLYVMRCPAMRDEVYKVGWTTNRPETRAGELTASTGVPLAFVVVRAWQHELASELESRVHAMLAPYRINNSREFFTCDLETIVASIEAEILRVGSPP